MQLEPVPEKLASFPSGSLTFYAPFPTYVHTESFIESQSRTLSFPLRYPLGRDVDEASPLLCCSFSPLKKRELFALARQPPSHPSGDESGLLQQVKDFSHGVYQAVNQPANGGVSAQLSQTNMPPTNPVLLFLRPGQQAPTISCLLSKCSPPPPPPPPWSAGSRELRSRPPTRPRNLDASPRAPCAPMSFPRICPNP